MDFVFFTSLKWSHGVLSMIFWFLGKIWVIENCTYFFGYPIHYVFLVATARVRNPHCNLHYLATIVTFKNCPEILHKILHKILTQILHKILLLISEIFIILFGKFQKKIQQIGFWVTFTKFCSCLWVKFSTFCSWLKFCSGFVS